MQCQVITADMNPKLTAIIIAKNESSRLNACLSGLRFVHKLILVNNGSDDNTADIARKAGAVVVDSDSNDFSRIRNMGLAYAGSNWILYVDADEIVSPDLAAQIKNVVRRDTHYGAYKVIRRNFYLHRPWPQTEHIVRLFAPGVLTKWVGRVHESPVYKGETGVLTGEIIHQTHRSLTEMVDKTNKWSDIESDLRLKSGHPRIVSWRLLRVMVTAFIDSYIKKQGYKAGIIGIIESIFQSFSMFITYAKLWEKQTRPKI